MIFHTGSVGGSPSTTSIKSSIPFKIAIVSGIGLQTTPASSTSTSPSASPVVVMTAPTPGNVPDPTAAAPAAAAVGGVGVFHCT